MAASALQLHKLIKRLLEKSAARGLNWEPSTTGSSFRTRIGDFVVQIEQPALRSFGQGAEPTLTVTRIDGGHVATTGGINSMLSQPVVLQPGTVKMLLELWEMVANRDNDIDQLLKELG